MGFDQRVAHVYCSKAWSASVRGWSLEIDQHVALSWPENADVGVSRRFPTLAVHSWPNLSASIQWTTCYGQALAKCVSLCLSEAFVYLRPPGISPRTLIIASGRSFPTLGDRVYSANDTCDLILLVTQLGDWQEDVNTVSRLQHAQPISEA